MNSSSVVITGMGAISAVGTSCAALWSAIAEGRDGMREVRRFGMPNLPPPIAALVPSWDEKAQVPPSGEPPLSMFVDLAEVAAREAIEQANLQNSHIAPQRIAIVLGSLRGHRDGVHDLAAPVAERLRITGPRIHVATACASSTHALAVALDLVAMGAADVVLAGGCDLVTPDMLGGFHSLGLLAAGKCAPFSEPIGTTLGEGAGFLILESLAQARSRGATVLASLLGYGLSADAYHATSPDPAGTGVARAVSSALRDAGLAPERIGYVNAHGTGTSANDVAEWRALRRVFGDGLSQIPVSSTKSMLGHAQGAAGVLEAITTLLAMRNDVVPQTLHFVGPRPGCPEDPVASVTPRAHTYDAALSISAGFGGANAVLTMGRAELQSPSRNRHKVLALGAGAVGPQGLFITDFLRELDQKSITARCVPAFDLERLVPMADPRGLDPTGRYLTLTAASALADAEVTVRGGLRDRAGLFVGSSRLSPANSREFYDSIEKRGLTKISANACAGIVLNAPAGACSRLLSLRGPSTTLSALSASGLLAIIHAADSLSRHDEADLIVAGGVDEVDGNDKREDREAAGLLVLAKAAAKLGKNPVHVAGWGIAGPNQLGVAAAQALAMSDLSDLDAELPDLICGAADELAGCDDETVRALCDAATCHLDPAAAVGPLLSSASSLAAVAAVARLRQGMFKSALVFAASPSTVSCAMILRRENDHAS